MSLFYLINIASFNAHSCIFAFRVDFFLLPWFSVFMASVSYTYTKNKCTFICFVVARSDDIKLFLGMLLEKILQISPQACYPTLFKDEF